MLCRRAVAVARLRTPKLNQSPSYSYSQDPDAATDAATADNCLNSCTLCQLLSQDALLLLLLVLALDAHNTTAPLHTSALVELVLEALNQLAELTLVLVLHTSHSQSSGILLVNNGTQASLALQ